MSSGSAGYAHISIENGYWGVEGDRFAGAILLAEMLAWCDPAMRDAAWGESLFDPAELQKDGARVTLVVESLKQDWGEDVSRLFMQAWQSDTLPACPSLGEWLVALPEEVASHSIKLDTVKANTTDLSVPISEDTTAIQSLLLVALHLVQKGDLSAAITVYQHALSLMQPGSGRAQEIDMIIQGLQSRIFSPIVPPADEHSKQPEPRAAMDNPISGATLWLKKFRSRSLMTQWLISNSIGSLFALVLPIVLSYIIQTDDFVWLFQIPGAIIFGVVHWQMIRLIAQKALIWGTITTIAWSLVLQVNIYGSVFDYPLYYSIGLIAAGFLLPSALLFLQLRILRISISSGSSWVLINIVTFLLLMLFLNGWTIALIISLPYVYLSSLTLSNAIKSESIKP